MLQTISKLQTSIFSPAVAPVHASLHGSPVRPSSALILTGRYAFRTGATSQDAAGKMSTETMMPAYVKPAGYVSASVGRWGHLPPPGPTEFGFDDHLKLSGSGVCTSGKREYVPDLMHDFPVAFINRHLPILLRLLFDGQPAFGISARVRQQTGPYADNISYLDKPVGKLVPEPDRLKLRDQTLIVITGDNGNGGVFADKSTIGGRH